jgi:tRNA pseudouridine32 synthase/23S rRNA pseudouridine746 synthase
VNSPLPVEIHKPVIYGQQSAFELLSTGNALSAEQLNDCFKNGAVWLETSGKPKRLYDPGKPLKRGHKIHLYCNHSTLSACPYEAELIEDLDSFSIWNKPSGMLSQGSKWGEHWTLQHWIQQHRFQDRECYITHRLDRFTEGLMIVAHVAAINRQFHRLFEQKKIHKTYRAIVSGLLQSPDEIIINSPIQDKPAQSIVRIIAQNSSQNQTLLEIKPESGRKHQIRIHLADMGYPVLYDRQFGHPPFDGDMKLQASKIEFDHPVDQNLLRFSLPQKDLLSL